MSGLGIRGARAIVAGALLATAGAAVAAEPAPVAPPLLGASKPAPRCGELPRGSRAYRDCLAAQSRRDTTTSQPTVKPAFSSR